ncbi:MAG: hypothetical protein ACRD2N_21520 [Vicinamibacterales bacterium]
MKKHINAAVVLTLALAPAAPFAAQDPAKPVDLSELRHHIYVMEGALARAVNFGASRLTREVRMVIPDVYVLAGEAQARGVYLEGYGVFFDVEVPMLRQSMMWSLRTMMDQDDQATQAAITDLRNYLKGITNPATRASLESALKRLEVQATPAGLIQPRIAARGADVQVSAQGGVQGSNVAANSGPVAVEKTWAQDPNRAYTESVQRALIDAMLDFGPVMAVQADQWLTVAARDNERRDTLAPQDPFEEVVTVLLKIKGNDLQAFRSGKIDKEEAKRRVKIGEF